MNGATDLEPPKGFEYVVLTETDYNDTRFSGRHLEPYDMVTEYVVNGTEYDRVYASPTVNIYRDSTR